MNKAELARKIKELDGLSKEDKSALLELLNAKKKYGLVWEDKPEEVEQKMLDHLPVLKEVPDRAIISDNPDAPNHLLIEGDNLEALTALSYTHAGKIDVIYIDPPYNTGHEDFMYNDRYIEKENEYKHSMWLSFMKRRLTIAKKLLSDEGIIFISIDDNEQARLKVLCDEIFTENNFIGTYFWKRTGTPPALSYKIRRKLEFVLCFQKTQIPQRTFAQGYVDGGDAPLLNGGNPIGVLNFPVGSVHFNIHDGTYTAKKSFKINLLGPVIVEHGLNANAFRASGNFKWGQQNLDREVSEGTYFLIKSLQFSPRFQKSKRATKVPSNIIDAEVGVATNEDAQKQMLELGLDFPYAKPSSLISFLIKMPFWENKKITILDFFAGSGTTLHATMQLNAEDGGHRTCILCTNNENGICENVTYERNKRVINGYTKPNGEEVAGLTDNNLRYFRTELLPGERTIKNMKNLVRAATGLLCIKNDLYTEASFAGRKFNPNHARYFEHGDKRMLVIYNEQAIPFIVNIIKTMPDGEKIKVYVFAYGSDPYEADFAEVKERVTLCALPDAIYNAYKKVLPKRKPKFSPDDIVEEIIEEEAETAPEGTLDFNNGYNQEGGDK